MWLRSYQLEHASPLTDSGLSLPYHAQKVIDLGKPLVGQELVPLVGYIPTAPATADKHANENTFQHVRSLVICDTRMTCVELPRRLESSRLEVLNMNHVDR